MTTVSIGQILFKWRSFTPVPVIALVMALLWRSQPASGLVDQGMDALGLLLAVLGQALRAFVLGQVPEGTSGQGNALEASTLNTRGPYARVRNPLYVGNLLIVAGLLCIAFDPWAFAIALGFFFGEYYFIIRAEENFLRQQFGEIFDRYVREVPRWVPRLRPANDSPLSERFDWRRALRKEHNPFTAWATGALALFAWEWWRRDATGFGECGWMTVLGAEAVLLVAFFAVKGWKHRWFARPQPTA